MIRGQEVWDEAGYKYLYADKVEDGHYVNKIVIVQTTTYRGDDFEEHEVEGELVFLREVFEKPPRNALDTEIALLSEQKKSLAADVYDLEKKSGELRHTIDTYKDELEKEIRKYPHHDMFLHVVNGGELIYVRDDFYICNENWFKSGGRRIFLLLTREAALSSQKVNIRIRTRNLQFKLSNQ